MGLDLAIVYELIKHNNGAIEVHEAVCIWTTSEGVIPEKRTHLLAGGALLHYTSGWLGGRLPFAKRLQEPYHS